jgi:hypothetical protein
VLSINCWITGVLSGWIEENHKKFHSVNPMLRQIFEAVTSQTQVYNVALVATLPFFHRVSLLSEQRTRKTDEVMQR